MLSAGTSLVRTNRVMESISKCRVCVSRIMLYPQQTYCYFLIMPAHLSTVLFCSLRNQGMKNLP
jgi:hypothetical protein